MRSMLSSPAAQGESLGWLDLNARTHMNIGTDIESRRIIDVTEINGSIISETVMSDIIRTGAMIIMRCKHIAGTMTASQKLFHRW